MSTKPEDFPDLKPDIPIKLNIRYPDVLTPERLAMRYNYSHMCRLCAVESPNVIPLFKGDGKKYDIPGKIRKYLSLRVLASEFMPDQICEPCASTLLSWHELVRSARLADFLLRRRVGSTSIATIPSPPPSTSSGTEVIKNGVNENLNSSSSINEHEDSKRSCEKHKTMPELSVDDAKVIERTNVIINQNGKRYVTCDMCKKNVATSSWQRHLRVHRGERRYSCHACGMAFGDSGNLARHTRTRHALLRPHACPECGRAFARKTHLQDHVRSHREARDYVCDVCGKASKSAAALRMHTRTHDTTSKFQCMECGSKFKRNGELKAHLTIHTGERAHRCPCGKAFRLRSQLTVHARTHAGKPIEGYVDVSTDVPVLPPQRCCKTCSLHLPAPRYNFHEKNELCKVVYRCWECHSYLDKDDVLFHYNKYSFEGLPDERKADFYRTEKAILEELVKFDPQAQIELNQLNDYFHRKKAEDAIKLERVDRRSSEPNSDDQQSEGREKNAEPVTHPPKPMKKRSSKGTSDEGRSPPKRKAVEMKRTWVSEPSPVKRQKKRVFITKNNQRRKDLDDGNGADDEIDASEASPGAEVTEAKKESSDKSPKASRTCPICGKQYRASSSYFYHMKYFHKRSREHECPVCNKKFGTKANLTQHASIHTGSYNLECQECGKRFKSKPSLYIHEQSHSGAKRWACSTCGRSFRWRTHLARHMTRHAAERAHVCGTCGRGFSVRCDLLRHARTHAADEYHCGTCGLKFAQKRYLQVHMVKKHPETPTLSPVVTRS